MKLSPMEVKDTVSSAFPRTMGKYGLAPAEWQIATDRLNALRIESSQLSAIVNGLRAESDRFSLAKMLDQAKRITYGVGTGSAPKPAPLRAAFNYADWDAERLRLADEAARWGSSLTDEQVGWVMDWLTDNHPFAAKRTSPAGIKAGNVVVYGLWCSQK